jgi:hypothetical protein
MDYTITAPDTALNELWQEKSIYILAGGFKLDVTNLPTGLLTLQKGQMLYVNFATRVAYAVKTAVVYETYTGTATSIKVNKGHLFKVGDHVSYGGHAVDITVITTSNALYDTFTLSGQLDSTNITAAEVLWHATSEGSITDVYTPNALNYFEVDKPLTGTPAVTALGRAYEIKTALMPNGITAAQIVSLGSRFMFI